MIEIDRLTDRNGDPQVSLPVTETTSAWGCSVACW